VCLSSSAYSEPIKSESGPGLGFGRFTEWPGLPSSIALFSNLSFWGFGISCGEAKKSPRVRGYQNSFSENEFYQNEFYQNEFYQNEF
jgi:hypothetical protein